MGWAEEIWPLTDPGHRGRPTIRETGRECEDVIDKAKLQLAIIMLAITERERRRPDRSKGHEVEEPGHGRLDMPEAERRRQGTDQSLASTFC